MSDSRTELKDGDKVTLWVRRSRPVLHRLTVQGEYLRDDQRIFAHIEYLKNKRIEWRIGW